MLLFSFCDELNTVNKQTLEQLFADIAFVSDKLPVQEFHERLMLQCFTVIYVSRCNHETEQLSFLVTGKVELESKEPSHGAFFVPTNQRNRFIITHQSNKQFNSYKEGLDLEFLYEYCMEHKEMFDES